MVTARSGRNRLLYAVLLLLTIFLGLASRRFAAHLPWWLAKNAGDVLYVTTVCWLADLMAPSLYTRRAALVSLLVCAGIEFVKFYHAPWLDTARQHMIGRLILGSGFHGSNLVCYLIGVLIAVLLETGLLRRRPHPGFATPPPSERERGQ